MTIPGPSMLHYRGGRKMMNMRRLSRHGRVLRRSRRSLRQGRRGLLRRGLPLSAARRHLLRLSLRSRAARDAAATAATTPTGSPKSMPAWSATALKDKPADLADHHASLPRQFPLDLHRVGRLRAGRRRAVQRASPSTAISWSGTPTAPAASSRCASCRRARRWCSAWSPPRPARSRSKDDIKRRIEEAAKFVDLDQLCLSPAMRLRLHGGGQRARRGRAMGQASHDRRDRRGGLGLSQAGPAGPAARLNQRERADGVEP